MIVLYIFLGILGQVQGSSRKGQRKFGNPGGTRGTMGDQGGDPPQGSIWRFSQGGTRGSQG